MFIDMFFDGVRGFISHSFNPTVIIDRFIHYFNCIGLVAHSFNIVGIFFITPLVSSNELLSSSALMIEWTKEVGELGLAILSVFPSSPPSSLAESLVDHQGLLFTPLLATVLSL